MKPHPPTIKSTSSPVASKPLWMRTEWPPIKRSTQVSVYTWYVLQAHLLVYIPVHVPHTTCNVWLLYHFHKQTHTHSPVHDHHVPVPVCCDVWWRWSRYHPGVLRCCARLIWEETQQLPGTRRRGALLTMCCTFTIVSVVLNSSFIFWKSYFKFARIII